jgi:DivIVA domain-containing protein
MELSPQQVRSATFRTAKKGFDPDDVTSYLRQVGDALESAQNQSAAMEARARAAVARLQELSAASAEADAAAAGAPSSNEVTVEPDQAEVISRTLVLAQRTADTTVAEARLEAERILAAAREEATSTIDATRELSTRLVEEARVAARAASIDEQRRVEAEVQSLIARRDFLVSDVEHLEQFLIDQRDRLRDAAASLVDLTERVPGGLGAVRRPVLSASNDLTPVHGTEVDPTAALHRPAAAAEVAELLEVEDDAIEPVVAETPATVEDAPVAAPAQRSFDDEAAAFDELDALDELDDTDPAGFAAADGGAQDGDEDDTDRDGLAALVSATEAGPHDDVPRTQEFRFGFVADDRRG